MRTLKWFDSLEKRDFDNAAINNDIRTVFKERDKLAMLLENLASAAARIVEDDAKPTLVHMRELDRCRADASLMLSIMKAGPK